LSADASFTTTASVRALARPRFRPRIPRGRSDDALVARVRAGDERAFELVFDRYHRGLLAFCRRMLASDEEAEDALQHTFMAAYRALRADDGPIRLKAWLYTIARNRCLSLLRARREQVAFDDGHAATHALAVDVERRADLRGLVADLQRLPDEQRAALVLFELGDHSHDDIAEVLGVRREKVKALVFQARESLASWRRARETPCVEIREQLATLRGAALKRATLRRHVARCEDCAEFEVEVRRQRAGIAALLPVVPAAGLKSAVLGAVGVGTAAGAGGGVSLAGLGGAAKGVAAKTMLCAAVAGGAGSAGYVAVHEVQMHDARGIVAATGSRHRHGVEHRAPKASAKPIVAAPAPVVVAAAATGRSQPREHERRGGRARHGERAAWMTRHGSRAGRDARHRGTRRGARGPEGAGRGARRDMRRGRSQRGDPARRGGSARRAAFAERTGSAPRTGFAQRGGSAQRSDPTPRDRSRRGGGKRIPSRKRADF
jgi:RNA polymerase sigma factor (sigma-70 family)